MTATSSGECPHCGERVESVAAFDRHLADRHGLRRQNAPTPPPTLEHRVPEVCTKCGAVLYGKWWDRTASAYRCRVCGTLNPGPRYTDPPGGGTLFGRVLAVGSGFMSFVFLGFGLTLVLGGFPLWGLAGFALAALFGYFIRPLWHAPPGLFETTAIAAGMRAAQQLGPDAKYGGEFPKGDGGQDGGGDQGDAS